MADNPDSVAFIARQPRLSAALVNVVSLAVGLLLVLPDIYSDVAKAWVLLVVASARTALDYWLCWSFYFPTAEAAGEQKLRTVGSGP